MIYTKEKWQELFNEWKQSGLTRAAFCRKHKLAVSTFDYWRRRIRERSRSKSELVKVSVNQPSKHNTKLILELPGGIRLDIPSDYCSDHLKRLITDLRGYL